MVFGAFDAYVAHGMVRAAQSAARSRCNTQVSLDESDA